MPNPKPSEDFRNVTVLARGDVLRAIQERADTRSLSLNKAATSLIEDGLSAAPGGLVNLETVSNDDLIDELVGRLQQMSDLAAAEARAEAAEAKLSLVASALGTIGG